MTVLRAEMAPYLDHLKSLSFVKAIRLRSNPPQEIDAILEMDTPEGDHSFALEIKRTFLDRALANAIIALAGRIKDHHKLDFLLMAPYVPRPTGEAFAEAGVNFVDRQGNVRLSVGDRYHTLILGKRRDYAIAQNQATGAASVQVILAYLVSTESVQWSVRKLAEFAGVSKTRAAEIRRHLVEDGLLDKTRTRGHRIADRNRLEERFLHGYGAILRPRIIIGTFRPRTDDPEQLLRRLKDYWPANTSRWAVTGSAAAYALQKFYRGSRTSIFIETFSEPMRKSLQMLPDPNGPVTFLKVFGHAVHWKQVSYVPLAHPWLIYAELMHEQDPRAREAAEQLRETYLK